MSDSDGVRGSNAYCHECEMPVSTTDGVCNVCSGGFCEFLADDEIAPSLRSSPFVSNQSSTGTPAVSSDSRSGEGSRNLHLMFHADPGGGFRLFFPHGEASSPELEGENLFGDAADGFGRLLETIFGGPMGQGSDFPVYLSNLNLGDYVFGEHGVDTIITQLLNQIDNVGPLPAPAEKIDNLVKVEASQVDIDRKAQCLVCFEDLVLAEELSKMACGHMYHLPCIKPWLELHNSCPVCRKDIDGKDVISEGYQSNLEEPPVSTNQQSESMILDDNDIE